MSSNSSSSRQSIPMVNKYDRVVLLVDMDCFYCQVEEKLDPALRGLPIAVVQYNAWRGGGIIAVNYPARANGVTRHMRGDEAKTQCPDIQLVKVPNIREKADLTKYREAGKDVANVLQRFTPLLERASVDEAYLDITDLVNKRIEAMNDGSFVLKPQELINTYAVGFSSIGEYVTTITKNYINPLLDNDDFYRHFQESDIPAVRLSNIRLLIGASIASEIRAAVYRDTGYECSAGIAHNKILAKLACGINKPNKQTILPLAQIQELFETLPVSKIKGLGAKFGEEVCQRMGIKFLGQLLKFTEAELQRKFDEKNGTWLYNICRGIDLEAVTPRFYSKSIGCCKKFPGRNNITGLKTLQHWLLELANEIVDRLEKDIIENNRRAKQMVVNFVQEFNSEEVTSSRSAQLTSYDTDALASSCLELIKANTKQFFRAGSESVLNNPIKFLGISVGKFETISNSQNNIQNMFAQQAAKRKKLLEDKQVVTSIGDGSSPLIGKTEKLQTTSENEENSKIENTSESKQRRPSCAEQGMKETLPEEEKASTKKHENIVKNNESNFGKQKPQKNNEIRSFFSKTLIQKTIATTSNCNGNPEILKESKNVKLQGNNECSRETLAHLQHDNTRTIHKYKEPNIEESDPSNSIYRKIDKSSHDNKDISPNISSHISKCSEIPNIESEGEGINAKFSESTLEENPKDLEGLKVLSPDFLSNSKKSQIERQSTSCSPNEDELDLLINDLGNIQSEDCNIEATANMKPISNKRKFNEISGENNSAVYDYRTEYAEFAIPVLNENFLQYTNCSSCRAKILNDPFSIQTHQDHHYAHELSQQQRIEYRESVRTKISAVKSPTSKTGIKKNQKKSTNSQSEGITKFLKPSTSEIKSPSDEICDICKIPIKYDELMEHKDFHLAKDLQRKMNQLEVRTVNIPSKISEASRKTLNNSQVNIKTNKSKLVMKPIKQFFKQSNI
ncbi:DNA polymerase eta [Haematobia irritans]|uniref:DNA polymerase eta n=1 Tax=Haematobia irritans TaxID=7368 RepID=UPI003F50AF8D